MLDRWYSNQEHLRGTHAGFDATGNVGIGTPKQNLGRIKRGTKTSEAAFREPILRTLVDAGGSMSVSECLDALGVRMADQFNSVDYQVLPSDQRTLRWRNTAQWARNELADQGLIDRSVRGVWAITDAGREWLERRT